LVSKTGQRVLPREWAGWIADDDHAWFHGTGYDGAHADHRAGADAQWHAFPAVAKDRPAANVRVVPDMHISVAPGTRSESHEVADHAIVRDVGVHVCMEVTADPNVDGRHREGAENGSGRDRHVLVTDEVARKDADRSASGALEYVRETLPLPGVGYADIE
jgi:hypothetical protein